VSPQNFAVPSGHWCCRRILQRAWFNFDLSWAVALVVCIKRISTTPTQRIARIPRMGAHLDLLNHPWLAVVAVVVHTLGHLLVAGLVAMVVYEKLGVNPRIIT
jgi:hypothetical protein